MATALLVPLDGSPLAEEAITAVDPLVRDAVVEVVLLRAVPSVGPIVAEGRVVMTSDEATQIHRREAVEYLERLAAVLRRRGLRVRARVETGDPAETILAVAGREGVAAIAMATHGRTGLGRLLFGSVTAAVVKASPVPVLTVHSVHSAPARPALAPAGAAR